MPAIFQSEANALLNASLDNTAYTPTPSYAALLTTASSVTAMGTEVSGGGYARQLVAWAAASAAQKANSGALNFTNMPAATVVGLALLTALTGGSSKWFGPLATQRTTAAGDSLSIAAGQLVGSLA